MRFTTMTRFGWMLGLTVALAVPALGQPGRGRDDRREPGARPGPDARQEKIEQSLQRLEDQVRKLSQSLAELRETPKAPEPKVAPREQPKPAPKAEARPAPGRGPWGDPGARMQEMRKRFEVWHQGMRDRWGERGRLDEKKDEGRKPGAADRRPEEGRRPMWGPPPGGDRIGGMIDQFKMRLDGIKSARGQTPAETIDKLRAALRDQLQRLDQAAEMLKRGPGPGAGGERRFEGRPGFGRGWGGDGWRGRGSDDREERGGRGGRGGGRR